MSHLKKIFLILLSILLVAGCAPAPAQPTSVPAAPTTPPPAPASTAALPAAPGGTAEPTLQALSVLAVEFVDQLVKGDFEAATSRFDSAMKTAAPASKLKEIWAQLLGQLGAFKQHTGTHSQIVGEARIIFVTCEFEKSTVELRVPFNAQDQIVGFFVNPAGTGLATVQPYNPPAYVKTGTFHEVEVTVGSGGDWPLPATLTLPNGPGPFPALVLVHGSGPNDRDETIGPNKPFRDLAWGLASQGVAVLRYEKRTRVYGSKLTPDQIASLTVKEETTDDAVLAVQLLSQTQGINEKQIFVLGHSLGAMLAPRLGQQLPNLAGLVLMAAPARPLEDVTLDQVIYLASLNGAPTDQSRADEATFETQVARVKSPDLSPAVSAKDLPLGISATYWLDLRSYNPVETAKSLAQPLLILQGGRDYQVLASKDFAAWQQALAGQKSATLKLYPALNHLFISGSGGPLSTPADYNAAGHVSEETVNDIAKWIFNK